MLHFLHREVLCGPYDPDATELSGVFESGTFNCVSSAVLFQALCQQISLETWPILAAGHVSHVVPSGGRPWLVETTAVQWADILASGDGRADLSGRESVDGVAPRRPLRPAQLLSVIYYNQAVRQLAAGLYAQSLDANLAAWRVDPENPDVRRNLLVTINNWAVALAGAGHYADAAALLASGRRIDPGYDKFRHNEAFLQDRWWRQRQDRHPQSATCPPPATVSEIRAWNWFRISEFPAPRG
ncbi:MAG: hypothetical protein GTO03_12340 [Planctomycetales bacterium]|nr:hypothetical protein [Planctomycetales bacterium]